LRSAESAQHQVAPKISREREERRWKKASSGLTALGAVGDGQHEDLTACFDAVEQGQESGDDRDLILGALGRARWGNGIDLVEEDDGRGKLLCAREDLSERGLGLADRFGQQCGAIDYLNVGTALAGNSAGEKGLACT
jgi:hypothetical protein